MPGCVAQVFEPVWFPGLAEALAKGTTRLIVGLGERHRERERERGESGKAKICIRNFSMLGGYPII